MYWVRSFAAICQPRRNRPLMYPRDKWSFDDGVFALIITMEDGGDIEMNIFDDDPAEPEDDRE